MRQSTMAVLVALLEPIVPGTPPKDDTRRRLYGEFWCAHHNAY